MPARERPGTHPGGIEFASCVAICCAAGITTFNALRGLDVEPGALVGIQGIGGLGHLGGAVRQTSWATASLAIAPRCRKSLTRSGTRCSPLH